MGESPKQGSELGRAGAEQPEFEEYYKAQASRLLATVLSDQSCCHLRKMM